MDFGDCGFFDWLGLVCGWNEVVRLLVIKVFFVFVELGERSFGGVFNECYCCLEILVLIND